MPTLHPLLERQLKRIGLTNVSSPPSAEGWQRLIERISQAYAQSEQDRYLLERSLSVSSEEMQAEIAERKKAEAALQKAHEDLSQQYRRLNRVNALFRIMMEQLTQTVQRGATTKELLNELNLLQIQFERLDREASRTSVQAE